MKKFVIALFLFTGINARAQNKPEEFKNGDKIVFAGNSITEAGFYGLYIWQYYMLHFPDRKIVVANGGVGGDVAGQILARFDGDIIGQKPTVVVLTFGMNDSRYFEYFNKPVAEVRKEAVQTSFNSYKEIEKKMQALPGIKKIIMTSSPYDETVTGPQNNFHGKYGTMLEIAKFQKESAIKNRWAFVDLMTPMTAVDEREQKRDTNFTLTGTDRIHPGNAGHLAMAYFFLKSQGLGGPVADVVINATTKKATKAVNSSISNIKSAASKISFDYKANSLPFPIDTVARVWGNPQKQIEALAVIPFTNDFNKEQLAVTGLKATGKYSIKIDGAEIGQWKGSELSKGINLAMISTTPQYQQAQKIADLNLQYRDIEQKIRGYYWLQYNFFKKKNMFMDDSQAAMDSVTTNAGRDWGVASKKGYYEEARTKEARDTFEKQMNTILDKIYATNKPLKHSIEISPVK